jgi:non-heme chloroperoxidase
VLVGATPRFSAAASFPYGLPPKEAEGMRLKVRRNLERALEGFHRNLFVEHELDDPVVAQQVAEQLGQVVMPQTAAALAGLEALMEEELMEEALRRWTCPNPAAAW